MKILTINKPNLSVNLPIEEIIKSQKHIYETERSGVWASKVTIYTRAGDTYVIGHHEFPSQAEADRYAGEMLEMLHTKISWISLHDPIVVD